MSPPEELPPHGLIARLDEALRAARRRPPSRPALAFDADGTLWSGDVGDDLLEAVLARRAVRPHAAEALRRTALDHGLDVHEDPVDQARALYEAHRRGALPDRVAFAMAAWVFAGHRADEVYVVAEQVLRETNIDARMHPEITPVLAWARGEGVDVFVVSASPSPIVEQGAARLSIARRHVLAMRPDFVDGLVAPRVIEPLPYAEGKVELLERAAPDLHLLGAFGDSAFDAPMLRRAVVPVAVRPKPSLLAVAPQVPGLARLALPST